MNWKLLAIGKGVLRKKLEGCSCAKKASSCVLNFPYIFLYFFSRELFLVAVHGWLASQTNVWKVQNTIGRFLAQLHPSNFFLKILFLVLKVSN